MVLKIMRHTHVFRMHVFQNHMHIPYDDLYAMVRYDYVMFHDMFMCMICHDSL